MKSLGFAIELSHASVLLTVFTHFSRLGGTISYALVRDTRLQVVVLAPERSAHRFGPQIRAIVGVVQLSERSAAEVWPEADTRAGDRLYCPELSASACE